MTEQILQFDRDLFGAINQGLSNSFFDWLMPLLRNRFLWIPLYLFLVIFFVRNYSKNGVIILLFFALTFSVTDFFVSAIMKPSFQRLRPCNDPGLKDSIHTLIACGSGYSFPSTHAANHFSLAVFLCTVFYSRWKNIAPLTILWAVAISFAQVYVGVHYPLDVLSGAITGSLIGYLTGTLLLTLLPHDTWKAGN